MKTKRFGKKLVLRKTTVVHLDKGEMKAVEGKDEVCATGELPTCITFMGYTCPKKTEPLTGFPCIVCGIEV
jgi:hypothetical protein